MKNMVKLLMAVMLLGGAYSTYADGCGVVAMDSNGVSVSCIGTKTCKAKAGKWVKCDGKKIRIPKK